MAKYQEIRKESQDRIHALVTEVGMFFAFSNEQFQENKTPLKEDEKYVSIGAGGYLPSGNVKRWIDGVKEIKDWEKAEIRKERNAKEEHILYELKNHECFYSNDISDVLEVLPYPKKDITKVYLKYRDQVWAKTV